MLGGIEVTELPCEHFLQNNCYLVSESLLTSIVTEVERTMGSPIQEFNRNILARGAYHLVEHRLVHRDRLFTRSERQTTKHLCPCQKVKSLARLRRSAQVYLRTKKDDLLPELRTPRYQPSRSN